jgi:hypothetical protein
LAVDDKPRVARHLFGYGQSDELQLDHPAKTLCGIAGEGPIWRPFKREDAVELPDFYVIFECVAEEYDLDALTRVSIAHVGAAPFIRVMTT